MAAILKVALLARQAYPCTRLAWGLNKDPLIPGTDAFDFLSDLLKPAIVH